MSLNCRDATIHGSSHNQHMRTHAHESSNATLCLSKVTRSQCGYHHIDSSGGMCQPPPCVFQNNSTPQSNSGKYCITSWRYADRNKAPCFVPLCFSLVGDPYAVLPAIPPGGSTQVSTMYFIQDVLIGTKLHALF